MGSWFETCGISGLPIVHGTPCLLLPIKSGGSARHRGGDGRSGFCDPSGLWEPRCLPVLGTYDDTGLLDLNPKEPAHWSYTAAMLTEDGLQRQEESGAAPVPIEARYDAAFFEDLERERLSAKSPFFGIYALGQTLIRADVWEHLLNTDVEGWNGTRLEENGREAEAYVDHIVRELQTATVEPDLAWYFRLADNYVHERRRSQPRPPFHWVAFENGEGFPVGGNYRARLTTDLIQKKVEVEVARAVFRGIADFAHVGRLMGLLRRAWGPQSGKGSQDTEWALHRDFATKISTIAEKGRAAEEE